LAAIEIMKLKHIVILQNKIDLVKEAQAKEQYEQILKFIQGANYLPLFILFLNVKSMFSYSQNSYLYKIQITN